METTTKKKAAPKAKKQQTAPAGEKVSKTWQAALDHQGYLIINDPSILL